MLDPAFPFAAAGNWKYSIDNSGGSPGRMNSVNRTNPDLSEPYISNCYALSPSSLKIDFSEPVTDLASRPACISIDGEEIAEIQRMDSLPMEYRIILSEDLEQGVVYTLDFKNVSDFAGNMLYPSYCQAGLFSTPLPGDLVINELLFDPLPGESEFIEFFNRSDKIIDMSNLNIACINLQSGDTGSVSSLSDEPRQIMPESYYVICEEKESIINSYTNIEASNIFEAGKLASLPDKEGRVLLFRKDLLQIDAFSYSGDFHSDMLSSTEGVSLERISPDIQTNIKSNWHSASGLSGWATPGLKNSVFSDTDLRQESSISLSSSRITPDSDGFEDYLLIQFNLEEGEWIIDIRIFNDLGYQVKNLCENLSAYGSESICWHGTDINGNILPSGLYIVFVEALSSTGKIIRWKKVCSVLRR